MMRFKGVLSRISRPLRAVEWVIPVAILISTVVSAGASILVEEHGKDASSTVSRLVEQFEIVTVIYCVLAVFAVVHLWCLSRPTAKKTLRCRQIGLFTFSIGLFFLGMLTMTAFGFLHLLWVNEFAISSVSALLYLNMRMKINEYQ